MTRVNVDVDPDDISSNTSGNRHFQDVLSRRSIIKSGTVVAAAGFMTAGLSAGALAEPDEKADKPGKDKKKLLGFQAVPTGTADAIVVPAGYTARVLIPWGTPLNSDGPAFKKDASNTAAEQEQQIGAHHDGMHLFPLSSNSGLLAVNHEYIDTTGLYTDGDAVITKEKVAKALAAHGVSVVKLERDNKRNIWKHVDSRFNRRVTGNTPVKFSGPVSVQHAELQSNNAPKGTLNNCSSGYTPWGTYLTCEENWNGYFGTQDASWTATVEQKRYGVTAAGFGYKWHQADERFDLVKNPKELNRFGWVVEIDPFSPDSTPVKRTALGRFKHEGATVTEVKDRVVVYSGDDQDGEYVYKFVGEGRWRSWIRKGQSPLDHGTLYVAKFNDDGSGVWLPLVFGEGPLTTANGWKDQADVLIRTRTAADAVGATKLDRPEWVAVNPNNQDVFLTLTNGSGNGGAVGPRKPNPYGHIVRWTEKNGDNTSLSFTWDVFVLSGDPAYDASVTLGEDSIHGSPDGIGFDEDGRLWIETDISNSSQNLASKGYDNIGNNMLLAADPETKEIKRFLVGPRGAEITGLTFSNDRRTLFVNIQHPGESTTAWGAPTPANPRAVSNWPDFDPAGRPRSATVVITKDNGGRIGT